MFDIDLGFYLGAGIVAAFNPCGFAMLPAYLSYFLGLESEEETNVAKNVARGLLVGLTMSFGFVVLFGLVGVLTSTLISQGDLSANIGYATIAFGVLMLPLGVAMVLGYEPKLNIPRFQKGGGSRDLPSVFLFGVSFGVVSISCTAPVFLASVIGSFTRDGTANGIAAFVAYAAGMSLVIMVLTLGLALARTSIAANMRRVLPYVNRASGVLLFCTGIVLIIYGWWEIRVLEDATEDNPIAETLNKAEARLNTWITDVGTGRFAWALVMLVAFAIVMALRSSLTRPADRWVVLGGFGAIYAFVEFVRFEADLLVLPFVRTLGDIPERVGNWFTDPVRWAVFWEVLLAILVGVVAFFWVRNRVAATNATSTAGAPTTEGVGSSRR